MVPAQHYAKNGATVQTILRALVDDFNQLSQHGVEAVMGETFSIIVLGKLGD